MGTGCGTEERGGGRQDRRAAGLRDHQGPSTSEAPQAQLRQDTNPGLPPTPADPNPLRKHLQAPTGTRHTHLRARAGSSSHCTAGRAGPSPSCPPTTAHT